MPTTVSCYTIAELAKAESKNDILLQTKENTELHIIAAKDRTVIRFPFGNKFDVVDGCIIIHEK